MKSPLSLYALFTPRVIITVSVQDVSRLYLVGVRNMYETFVIIICRLFLNLLIGFTPAFSLALIKQNWAGSLNVKFFYSKIFTFKFIFIILFFLRGVCYFCYYCHTWCYDSNNPKREFFFQTLYSVRLPARCIQSNKIT